MSHHTTYGTLLTTSLIGALLLASSAVWVSVASARENRTLLFALKGTAVGKLRTLPVIAGSGTSEGNCFDVPVVNMLRGKTVGTASHCFTDVKHEAQGMVLTDTMTLDLPDGQIVSQDRVTVQPALQNSGGVTHIAGTLPTAARNNIIGKASTKAFRGARGGVRVASAMDMSRFEEKNEITFDDFVVVELIDSRADIRQVQVQLKNLGFYRGNIDGILGPRTHAALRAYQARHGLPTTGEVDTATSESLASP